MRLSNLKKSIGVLYEYFFVQSLHESNIAVCNDVFWGFIMSDKSMNLQTLKTFYTPVNK